MQHLLQEHQFRAAKRQLAGQKLVQHDAEAVNIAPAVGLVAVAGSLLGAHVRRRAEHVAVDGHGGLDSLAQGQAEIQNEGREARAKGRIEGRG